MRWFDCGINLTNSRLSHDVAGVLQRAQAVGVNRLLVIGTNLAESAQALALCEQFPEQLVATVGVHPHDAAAAPADFIEQLQQLAVHPSVVAIGECGLDFNRNYSPPEVQLAVFEAQLKLAATLQLPVYLHERDAHQAQCELLERHRASIPKMLTHCFTGGKKELARYLELGCYIGITGWVCDERRGQELQQAVIDIPDNRLLVETDAPYLTPRTVRPRSAFNEPCFLPAVGAVLAQLRQQTVAEVAATTWQNSLEFFSL